MRMFIGLVLFAIGALSLCIMIPAVGAVILLIVGLQMTGFFKN